MIVDINSKENATFKQIKQLQKKKYRDQYEKYIIEGVRIILDTLENHKTIEYIVYCDDLYNTGGGEELLKLFMDKKYKIYHLSNKLFSEITDTKNPQGILAVLPMEKQDTDLVLDKEDAFVIILDRIQDPGNLGTILRTADAAGAHAVFLSKGCVDLYNPKTIRSTMGSIYNIPVVNNVFTKELIHKLKSKGYQIISTGLEAKEYYFDIDFTGKTAIVIGNEAKGILQEILTESDHIVKIPMEGKAESLNAAVATSIMAYEVLRQKYSQKI